MKNQKVKKVGMVLLALVFFATIISLASAEDVAYLVENKYYVHSEFTNALNRLGLSYEVILNANISSTNFSKYKMIIFNDDDFPNPKIIPVNNFPAVIVTGKNMVDWGWCKYISKTSQDQPFFVDVLNNTISGFTNLNLGEIEIYDRIGPNVYNMEKDNIFSGIKVVASKKNIPGDVVVGVANAGDVLTYPGKPNTYVNAKTCFFGIYQSEYWTEDTRKLFEGCIKYVAITCSKDADCDDKDANTLDKCNNPGKVNSYCSHDRIACFQDSDCGTNFFSDNFCSSSSGDVFRNQTTFTCLNKGTTQAFCTNTSATNLVQDCAKGCLEGECIQAHDLGFVENYDGLGNIIRIKDMNNTALDEPVILTQKGTNDFGTKIINNGDFTETGRVECKIENASGFPMYLFASSFNLAPGEYTLEGKKDNLDLSSYKNGDYVIKCNITNLDDSPNNNYAEREFTINYPPIECSSNSECGANGFVSENFCTGKNITRKYREHTCNAAGTPASYCSYVDSLRLIQQCSASEYCSGGECKYYVCETNADCNDENPLTYDECINPKTPVSECRNTQINCASNLDCGYTGFLGTEYCNRNNVFKNNQDSLCRNPGMLNSYCTLRITASKIQDCEYACFNGTCIRCDSNSDCEDGNPLTQDICENPGTPASFCDNEETTIICDDNLDCGVPTSRLGCSGDYLTTYLTSPTCFNAGTRNSYCSNTSNQTQVACNFGCNSSSLTCNPDPFKPACSDNIDNDGDNKTDSLDPGCHSDGNASNTQSYDPNDNNEFNVILIYDCSDGIDNDNDQKVDSLDPGCHSDGNASNTQSYDPNDNNEYNPIQDIECYNNAECNDQNSYTWDICENPGTPASYCNNTRITCLTNSDCGPLTRWLSCNGDYLRNNTLTPTCYNSGTIGSYCYEVPSFTSNFCAYGCNSNLLICNPQSKPECSDEEDNDGDGLIDALDPGCHSDFNASNTQSYDPNDNNEFNRIIKTACSDTLDNDNDQKVDSLDPGCHSDGNASNTQSYDPNDNNETDEIIFIPYDSGWKNFNNKNGACIEKNGNCPDTACKIEGGYCGCEASGFGLNWIQLYPEGGCINHNGYRMLCQGLNSETWNCNIVKGTGVGIEYAIPKTGEYYLSIDATWDSETETMYVGANNFGEDSERRATKDFSFNTKCVFKETFNFKSNPAKIWVEASSNSESVHIKKYRLTNFKPSELVNCDA